MSHPVVLLTDPGEKGVHQETPLEDWVEPPPWHSNEHLEAIPSWVDAGWLGDGDFIGGTVGAARAEYRMKRYVMMEVTWCGFHFTDTKQGTGCPWVQVGVAREVWRCEIDLL